MADLAALIDRLEALTGPDAETDWLITQWADPGAVRHSSAHQHYTRSLDAVIALVERELPGRLWEVMGNGKPDDQPWASIHQDFTHWSGVGATPAIALCIALLKAKQNV